MSIIIEEIYGISFNNPPSEIKNQPFLNDEIIKQKFETYSKDKWEKLSKSFNFQGIIVPVNWNINLEPVIKSENFTFISARLVAI